MPNSKATNPNIICDRLTASTKSAASSSTSMEVLSSAESSKDTKESFVDPSLLNSDQGTVPRRMDISYPKHSITLAVQSNLAPHFITYYKMILPRDGPNLSSDLSGGRRKWETNCSHGTKT